VARYRVRDNDLAEMKLGEALRWAADDRGYLTDRERLIRLVEARGYKPGWVFQVYGEHWLEVHARCMRWRRQDRQGRSNA
jgi:hypothetical protein